VTNATETGLQLRDVSADPPRNVGVELALMSWSPLLRVMRTSRRSRRSGAASAPALSDTHHRHPAMIGIEVSPVHGWHCICDRCQAQAPKHV
jgi:hypothetical protein